MRGRLRPVTPGGRACAFASTDELRCWSLDAENAAASLGAINGQKFSDARPSANFTYQTIGFDGVVKEWPSGTVKDVPTYELGLDSCSADAGGTSPVCSEITNYQTATRAEYEALCKAEGAVFKTGDCRARHPDLRIRSACLGTGFKIEIKDVKGMAYFYDKGYPDDQARQACLAAGGQFTLPRTY